MQISADDMEDEIIELVDILENPEEEVRAVDFDDAGGDEFASALSRDSDALGSVASTQEDMLPDMPELDEESAGAEDELDRALISDEDMQPVGEFEGWSFEMDAAEAACEPAAEPCAGREIDEDGAVAFSESPMFTVEPTVLPAEEVRPARQRGAADAQGRQLDELTKEMFGITQPGALQFDFLTPGEDVHELQESTGGLPRAMPVDQTNDQATDTPSAGAGLVLDGLIAQLEKKLILNIQGLLESKMPGIVASVIGEELENLKKYVRRIENR
jgi:hypothetical protein